MEKANGGIEIEEVVIDGTTYRVRKEVADEIVNVRRGVTHEIIERIKAIQPKHDDTIIITTPTSVSNEFVGQVATLAKRNFPDHGIAVFPEALKLHTQDGLKQLLGMSMEMASAILNGEPQDVMKAHADAFVEFVQAKGLEDEEEKG